METDFRTLLADDAAVSALVLTRIYPATYPQAAADPCIRYAKISGAIGMHMKGSDGLATDLMQVDVRAATALEAIALRDAIVAKLHAFSGLQGATLFDLIALRDDRGIRFEATAPTSYYTTSLDFDVISRSAA